MSRGTTWARHPRTSVKDSSYGMKVVWLTLWRTVDAWDGVIWRRRNGNMITNRSGETTILHSSSGDEERDRRAAEPTMWRTIDAWDGVMWWRQHSHGHLLHIFTFGPWDLLLYVFGPRTSICAVWSLISSQNFSLCIPAPGYAKYTNATPNNT